MKKNTSVLLLIILSIAFVFMGCNAKKTVTTTNHDQAANENTKGNLTNSESTGTESKIIYTNKEYDFTFSLPPSWKGYKIVSDSWQGVKAVNDQGEKVVETGPMILIRHPEWTKETPRQDIPVMIFTLNQWSALQKDEFHIGAAPIGPKKLGQNEKYIFALPARYNFAFLKGYEEVESILNSGALKPIKVGESNN